MCRRLIALFLTLAVPTGVSAGPLKEAAEKAGRELAQPQPDVGSRSRGRFWTAIALVGGGGVLGALGSAELGDDETGPDDGEDLDDSDDGEDSDGWENRALLGSGIAAATTGVVLLVTGRRTTGLAVSPRPGGIAVSHTIGF